MLCLVAEKVWENGGVNLKYGLAVSILGSLPVAEKKV